MTMDLYEQKYKKALEKLQEAFAPTKDGCKISGLTRGCIENIFPELKESEDERIRKAIIMGIRHLETQLIGCDMVDGVDILDMYSWLEKQGHMLDPDKVIEWFRVNWWDSHIGNPIDKFKKDFGL